MGRSAAWRASRRGLAGQRHCPSAVGEADRAVRLLDSGEDEVMLVAAGWVYATCGRPERARSLLRRYETTTRGFPPDLISLGAVYAALGDTSRGFAMVERGVGERSPVAIVLAVDLMFDPLRTDPRWDHLVARVLNAGK